MCRSQRRAQTAFATLAALLLGAGAAVAAPPARVSANDIAFERAAKGVAKGQTLIVDGLLLDKERATATLELERIEVWRSDAVVMVDNQRVAVPKSVYFRGTIDGDAASQVLLSVRERGGVMGLVLRGPDAWAIGKGQGPGALRSRKADPEGLKKPFECGLDQLPNRGVPRGAELDAAPVADSPSTVPNEPYDATIAIDTDFEYFNMFPGATTEIKTAAALDYMGDLIGYADLVYSREIDTDMFIGYSRLWTTSADPWTATSSGAALDEFIAHWNGNATLRTVPRTVAHMLSGKNSGGGVAYLSVLCDWYGNPNSNLSYGYSGSLDPAFNWDGNQTHDPAAVVWEIMVVMHEIGHNFGSPHTHDYCGYAGNALPVDDCYDDGTSDGCDSGSPNVLPTCTGAPITAFHSGTHDGSGKGTIMSYCHYQLASGINRIDNIALTFGGRDDIAGGDVHPCGTVPQRVSARMRSHVVSRANAYPSCFVNSTCGNGTLDAGEQCDGSVPGGTTCASLGQGFVGGTLSCTSSCTFNTSQCTKCGNGVIDTAAGEVCDGTVLGGATCTSQGCTGGDLTCNTTCSAFDKSACTGCPPCNQNGICDIDIAQGQQETCTTCPSDCVSGRTSGAVCGNGLCEAGNNEDCLSCPSDCRGVQGGKPSGRYCCGDLVGGSNPIGCNDARCTSSGFSCTNEPSIPTDYCCGTGTCTGAENCGNCAIDCATGLNEYSCTDGLDNECDGLKDCADTAECGTADACLCKTTGERCTTNSECCLNSCRTKGKNAGTCA